MAVVLEGGCRVSTMHEGVPHVSGSLKIWKQIGKTSGAKAISLRVLEFGPGTSPVLRNLDDLPPAPARGNGDTRGNQPLARLSKSADRTPRRIRP